MREAPVFPNFTSIDPKNQSTIEDAIHMDELYSDYNFTSIYTWDTNGTHRFSFHNKNLILKLDDYVTGTPIFTVFGKNEIEKTIDEVLAYSRDILKVDELKLIPEQTIKYITDKSHYIITEDRDNFDYIYTLEDIALYTGRQLKSKRHAANLCQRNHDIKIIKHDTLSLDTQNSIIDMLNEWTELKKEAGKSENYSDDEIKALMRVFDHINDISALELHIAFKQGKVVGFAVDEYEANGYVLSHFCKTLPTIPGLTEYLNRYLANFFLGKGYKYWNWEQDTGNETLRRIKLSYRPSHFNKKYNLRHVS